MSSVCFISDLHLDDKRPAATRAFQTFLSEHQHSKSLYILGDLFEVWLGDDDDSPLATTVSQSLRAFSDAGCAVFIMPGNRDFLLGERFCEAAGASLLADPTLISLFNVPTLLMHGDSLCTADVDYQRFRQITRDPQWQAELLEKPLTDRRAIAAELRAASREANSLKSEDIMDVTPQEVEKMMRSHAVAQLIHGHTHRPKRHLMAQGVRWVLGAWDHQAWFVEASEGRLELNFIDIKQ
ncbi:MAG: UDP-2,3-diacylglucosamine diphosphatase [Pseudomonadota bacterium]